MRNASQTHLKGLYQKGVDLLVNPTLAKGDQIIAVPTPVKQLPPPVKKLVGDLADENGFWVGRESGP